MAHPEIEAVDGGFKYIMGRPGKFTLEEARERARASKTNNYDITVVPAPRPRHESFFEVTIKGNQAGSLSEDVRKHQNSGQINPYGALKGLTGRAEWVCGYWEFPPDTL